MNALLLPILDAGVKKFPGWWGTWLKGAADGCVGPEQDSKKSNSESKQMQLENLCTNDNLKDTFIMIQIQTYSQCLILFFKLVCVW